MALDAEFFDSIEIEVVKKKYYNANKVNAVFDEIRRQAEALSAENAMLRERLEQLEGRRVEIGDAVLSAQAIYQEIVRRANARADAIVAEAQRERARILDEGRARQDYAVHRVEEAFSRLRQMQLEQIDALNAQWQAFLCGLDTEDESEPEPPAPAPRPVAPASAPSPAAPAPVRREPAPARQSDIERTDLPKDLAEKVGAIADELFSIENGR